MNTELESVRFPWKIRAIFLFLLLVVVFDAPFDGVAIHAGRGEMVKGLVTTAAMWGPGLAAFAVCIVFRRSFRDLGFAWPQARYMWSGYLLPLVYATAAYGTIWAFDLAPAKFAEFQTAAATDVGFGPGAGLYTAAIIATYGVLKACANALGEEIGWRGFLVPALADRLRFSGVVVVSGLIWGAWHVPSVLWEGYNGGGAPLTSILFFSVGIVGAGGIAAWLRLRSGSIWPAVIFHGCHNAVIQRIFDPLTDETGKGSFYATEFGIALAISISVVFVALLLWGGVPVGAKNTKTPSERKKPGHVSMGTAASLSRLQSIGAGRS